jgi:cytoskeletal protein CcmA (bactofilin family)
MWWEKKSPQSEPPKPQSEPLKPQFEPRKLEPAASNPSEILKVERPMPETIRREPTPGAAGQVQAAIGRSLVIKGELAASEDLLIEGQFEGTLNVQDHCLTVGANGKVKAEIHARQVVILGSINGNVNAREKIELRRSGNVVGDLMAASVAIEEGAYFKGSIDIHRDGKAGESPVVAAASVFRDDD